MRAALGSASGPLDGRALAEAAARRALWRLGLPAHAEVRREPGGAPRAWLGPVPLPVHLSLSHSGGRAVAAASRARVGVDLVCGPLEDEGTWADFFSRAEREALRACPDGLRLGFSVKEAAWKALAGEGPSEFRHWQVRPASCSPRGHARGQVTTRAERGPHAGCGLSLQFWSWPSRGGRVALCRWGGDAP
jgi:4'-phosphopantetheinyl transferase EntD